MCKIYCCIFVSQFSPILLLFFKYSRYCKGVRKFVLKMVLYLFVYGKTEKYFSKFLRFYSLDYKIFILCYWFATHTQNDQQSVQKSHQKSTRVTIISTIAYPFKKKSWNSIFVKIISIGTVFPFRRPHNRQQKIIKFAIKKSANNSKN